MGTPPPPAGPPPDPAGGRLAGTNNLQRGIDALTRAMGQSNSNFARMASLLAHRGGGQAPGGSGFGGYPTIGMSPGVQAQWGYRFAQMNQMHAQGSQEAVDAHRTARDAAQRAHHMATVRWQNTQRTIADQFATRTMTPEQRDAALRRANISSQQFMAQTSLRDQRLSSADNQFTSARQRLSDQRDRLRVQYQSAQDRQSAQDERVRDRQDVRTQRRTDKFVAGVGRAAAGAVTDAYGRFATGVKDFNAGTDQYGRLTSLYGGFGGAFSGTYSGRAVRAAGQSFSQGLNNVAGSDGDLFTGMGALYRQNNFSNLHPMQRAAAASAFVSPEMGVSGAARMQAQMGTAKAYYAGQMFGLDPSIRSGGGKATPQQTFTSLFGAVSPKDLGGVSAKEMKAMLSQGGSLQTTLENYANASGLGAEGVQNAADYLTLSNTLRRGDKGLKQGDVDRLVSDATLSGKAGDKARETIKSKGGGVGEAYIDAQRRAEGAKREGKLDGSASYLTAAISSANTLIDIRELIKPVMEPIRKAVGKVAGGVEGGGVVGGIGGFFDAITPDFHLGFKKSGSGQLGGAEGSSQPKQSDASRITQPKKGKVGSGAAAAGAIAFARQQLGEPYRLGAAGPDAWDCSSLVQAAYKSIGVNLPRTTYQQINYGKDVDIKDVQAGDLLFYPNVEHVVMSIGDGKVIQAPHTGDVVKVSPLNESKYGRVKRMVGTVGTLSNDLGSGAGKDAGKDAEDDAGRTTSAHFTVGGAFGSVEEVDAVVAALGGGGASSAQQIAGTGAAPPAQNKDAKKAGGSSSASASSPATPSGNAALGKRMAKDLYHWEGGQWDALYQLWQHESNWRHTADNPSSHAYGIPQSLPGSKMASEGNDWRTNPATQIKWGLKYIKGRYGDPQHAWSFWNAPSGGPAGASRNWYREGAWEIPGDQDARLHKGEMVLDSSQAHTVRQALMSNSLRSVDPASGHSQSSGGGAVSLNFGQGSVVISMPSASEASSRSAARQFVDFVSTDDRIKKLMGGY